MKKHYFIMVLCLMSVFACTNDDILNNIAEQPIGTRTVEETAQVDDYKVSYSLLQKYLKLTKKDVDVQQITPLVREGDTLAYAVQYTEGWDVIAADQRLTPVMVTSDNGTLTIEQLYLNKLLTHIADVRLGSSNDRNVVWQHLITKKTVLDKKTKTRDAKFTIGMWIPEDTIYISDVNTIPHIISTNWHQNYPWNDFTPFDNGDVTPAGCSAIAVGQVVYHYRKNNKFRSLPTYIVSQTNGSTTFPNENTFSSSAWDYVDGYPQNAIFIAYLGVEILNQSYAIGGSGCGISDIIGALQYFDIGYDNRTSYNFPAIYGSLLNNKPVIVCAQVRNSNDGHTFIIDRYKISQEGLYINCRWDPNYVVDEETYYSYSPDWFQEPDGDPNKETIYKQHVEYYFENVYFGMNWGAAGVSNEGLYLAMTHADGGMTTHYSPQWNYGSDMTNGIEHILYNLSDIH